MPKTISKTNGADAANDRRALAGAPSGDAGLDLVELSGMIGFHLRMAQTASFRAFAARAGSQHVKPGWFAALMVLRNNPRLSQGDLGRAIAREKSTVTPLIHDLERRELVRRDRSAKDGRALELSLTAKGEAVLDELLIHAHAHDAVLDEIVGERKRELIQLLARITAGLG